MKSLASYLLEFECGDPEVVRTRFDSVRGLVREWLSSKKVKDTSCDSGEFVSLSGGKKGNYIRRASRIDNGELEETVLVEPVNLDQVFQTSLSIGVRDGGCALYANLSLGSIKSIVSPVQLEQKCPKIVRNVIKAHPDWKLGNFEIGDASALYIDDREKADALVTLIESTERRLPIVLISEYDGEVVWGRLGEQIAFDLAGLARVYEMSEDASWVLTQKLGKLNSCYLGAVRLYWPVRGGSDQFIPSHLWTASNLLSDDYDGGGCERFLKYVRRKVMDVAALTIELPKLYRDITRLSAREKLLQLEKRATDSSDVLELANAYANENDKLKEENENLRSEIHNLVSRVEIAEAALEKRKSLTNDEIAEDGDDACPVAGEVRFYKKTHSKQNYDVLVRVSDCGHNSWQGANKADKAKKGLERLLNGRTWKSLQHCGTCTGGGMWKVQW